ncbi:hypothetical protein SAMN05428945_2235 [Streptomyces sp. 2224.1]|nr:hypothetical protein BX261_3094 [Streptomyces sp. 2321.6]SDR44463.1 hypothetical protein SAMN05216511_4106 [Streptomyces sp. KS_16]SEC17617.1 hypothetical protein SAMN05428945_2235 [Streptomyces sp. 2224.1]SEC86568.1 hypothetical protein SAMN05428940_3097 [Streptomyces sp. 2133.1]SEE84750.1 hypothetical protein SAMN05428954_4144 [Streptomyces sp. 2112.3]SNC69246.1 hypothetical protein SAMN06272741_3090 [Streptomyces sp. 2114.4]
MDELPDGFRSAPVEYAPCACAGAFVLPSPFCAVLITRKEAEAHGDV